MDGERWQPKGVGSSTRRINSETEDTSDASKPEAGKELEPSAKDAGGAQPSDPPHTGPVAHPPSAGGSAQDAGAPTDPDPNPDASPIAGSTSIGSGGVGGDLASGAAGAAGSGGSSARQSLIDAAIEALGGGDYPWRSGGSGDGLSAELVKNVLFSLVASGTCFRDTRRCIQTCFVIASDCEPCAADPECADALKTVCGPLGTCSP